ncbi:MAG: translation elongation factor EF-1 subunit alpha [Candidatus Nanoarchaeia archaeon]
MARGKPHINLVVIGHVDHGKSTTVGRILFNTGKLTEKELSDLKKLAAEYGKAGFEFAFVMDKVKEERERGLTIDLSYQEFETNKYYFTIIDAPGHKDFIKNMITGTSQADAAVLVVSANPGEGVMEQTREHVFLAKTLGVPQLIVAVNKMDMAKYDEKRYNEVKAELEKLLRTIGYDITKIPIIPISAWEGENIDKPTTKMAWYKGPTLLAAFDLLSVPEKPINLPLRMPVQDVYTITGIGTVPVGRIETGILKVNDKIIVMPSGKQGDVKSIEMHHESMPQAEPGDNIGINVRGLGKEDIRRGDVIGHPNNPPTVAKEFTAKMAVLSHPTVITVGYAPVFHCHTAQVSCRIKEIKRKIDPKTGQTLQEKPDFIKQGDVAEVVVEPLAPLCIEKYSDFPQMAKFAVRDMGRTVAAGMVMDVVKR